jgi:hypothetical protein
MKQAGRRVIFHYYAAAQFKRTYLALEELKKKNIGEFKEYFGPLTQETILGSHLSSSSDKEVCCQGYLPCLDRRL